MHCRREMRDAWPFGLPTERDIVTMRYGCEAAACSPGCLVGFVTYAPDNCLGRPRARLLKWTLEMLCYVYGVVNVVPNPPRWLSVDHWRDGYTSDEFARLGELGVYANALGPGDQFDAFAPAASWRDMTDAASALKQFAAPPVAAAPLGRKNYYRSDATKRMMADAAGATDGRQSSPIGGESFGGGGGGGGGGGWQSRAERKSADTSVLPVRVEHPPFAKLVGADKVAARVAASNGGRRRLATIGAAYASLD